MRPTTLEALASPQALNRNPSDDLALGSCSDTLGRWHRTLSTQARHHERDSGCAGGEREEGADEEVLGHGQQRYRCNCR